jgi:hypothetical protein
MYISRCPFGNEAVLQLHDFNKMLYLQRLALGALIAIGSSRRFVPGVQLTHSGAGNTRFSFFFGLTSILIDLKANMEQCSRRQ